jgi:hypothetical protein
MPQRAGHEARLECVNCRPHGNEALAERFERPIDAGTIKRGLQHVDAVPIVWRARQGDIMLAEHSATS